MKRTVLYSVLLGFAVCALTLFPLSAVAGEGEECPIEAYVNVWNTGKMEGLDAVMAENVKRHVPSETQVNNIAELKQYIADFREKYADVKVTIGDVFYSADKKKSSTCWTCTGTHKALAKPVTFSGVSVAHWADGKCVEEWVFFDSSKLNEQLGYTVTPPEGLKVEKEVKKIVE